MSSDTKGKPSFLYVAAAEIDLLLAALELKASYAECVLIDHYRGENILAKTPKLLLNEMVCLVGTSAPYYRDLLGPTRKDKGGVQCYRVEQGQALSLSNLAVSITTITSDLKHFNITLESH